MKNSDHFTGPGYGRPVARHAEGIVVNWNSRDYWEGDILLVASLPRKPPSRSTMIFHILRMFIRLMADRRVPFWVKLVPVAAVIYIVSPIDLRPDFIPILGQLDDLLIAILLLVLFVALVPGEARRDAFRGGNANGGDNREDQVTLGGSHAPPG